MKFSATQKQTNDFLSSSSLILTPLPNLCLKPTLNSINTPPTPTALTRHKENPILLCEQRIGGLARFTGDVFDHVSAEDVFDLFLLEAAFDDEAAGAVDGACCAHFGEEELDDVFWLFFWRVGLVERGKGEKGKKGDEPVCASSCICP